MKRITMAPNPDQLWEDMEKLNALYQELCWEPDDHLEFGLGIVNSENVIVIKKRND